MGPIYHYDPDSKSSLKFPPHFDKAWFLAERQTKSVRVLKLDESGSYVIDSAMLETAQELNRPLDLEQGADGALYVVDYGDGWHSTNPVNTQIGRIEYTGSCHPGVGVSARNSPGRKAKVRIGARSIAIGEAGEHLIRQSDVNGRELRVWRGNGPQSYDLGGPDRVGVSIITVIFPKTGKSVIAITARP